MIQEKSAGVVVFRKEPSKKIFLLLNYPSGHWDFIKGKIENGESLKETAIREAKEETGIVDLDFIDGFKETIEYNFQIKDQVVHKEVVFFLAKTNTEKIILSHEHLDHVWLDMEKALKKTTYENAKRVLRKANELI